MKRKQGFTIVELLVAMALLGVVLTLAYGGIVTGARQQRSQEVLSNSQAKLRRVIEVMSQDIRSSIFGSISDTPYSSSNTTLSFTLLAGGAGYQVLPQNTSNTVVAGNLMVISPDVTVAPDLANGQALLVNASGLAVIFPVAGLTKSASNEWQLNFPSCGSVAYTPNTLIFRVATFGYRWDASSKILYYTSAGGSEQPLAYDISGFSVTYVYLNPATGALTERTTPERKNTLPQKVVQLSGADWTLTQIKLKLATAPIIDKKTVERKFETTIDLGATQTLQVNGVRPCS